MDEALEHAWQRLVAPLGVPGPDAGRALDSLAGRYCEPHRTYHTLSHVRHVLATVDMLLAQGEPADDPTAIRLAAWFHDAVYDPRAGDNEEVSARLAASELTDLGVAPARVHAVVDLVLATENHVAATPDQRVLVDADLAILAADPATYGIYTRAVRVEYAWLPEADWRAGRLTFLQRMLERERIYVTPAMRLRGEPAARDNLQSERRRLLA